MIEQNVTVTAPFPEIEQAERDKSVHNSFKELEDRTAREAEAELNAKLDQINSSGDLSSLSDMKLRIQFVEKFGVDRFSALNLKHIQRQSQERRAAELARKKHSK